jgi:uncharacterized protein (DUF433 family)
MSREYVEQRDGGYWIAGKRISLASVIYEFRDGAAPESIMRSFPLLTLEEVYGAITFYLSHQAEVDAYLATREAEFEEQRRCQREDDPEFFRRFDERAAALRQGGAPKADR